MQLLTIYTICLYATFGAIALWQISRLIMHHALRPCLRCLRKYLLYSLIVRRQVGTSDFTVFTAIFILIYITVNVIVTVYRISTKALLAQRLGSLAIINIVPLYLGGRTNFIVDRIFNLRVTQYELLHRWVGRVCVLQGVTHALIHITFSSRTLTSVTITVSSLYQDPELH